MTTTRLRMIVVTVIDYEADPANYQGATDPNEMAIIDQTNLKEDFVLYYDSMLQAVDGETTRLVTDLEQVLPSDQVEPIVIMPDGSIKKLIRGWGPTYESYTLAPR